MSELNQLMKRIETNEGKTTKTKNSQNQKWEQNMPCKRVSNANFVGIHWLALFFY